MRLNVYPLYPSVVLTVDWTCWRSPFTILQVVPFSLCRRYPAETLTRQQWPGIMCQWELVLESYSYVSLRPRWLSSAPGSAATVFSTLILLSLLNFLSSYCSRWPNCSNCVLVSLLSPLSAVIVDVVVDSGGSCDRCLWASSSRRLPFLEYGQFLAIWPSILQPKHFILTPLLAPMGELFWV